MVPAGIEFLYRCLLRCFPIFPNGWKTYTLIHQEGRRHDYVRYTIHRSSLIVNESRSIASCNIETDNRYRDTRIVLLIQSSVQLLLLKFVASVQLSTRAYFLTINIDYYLIIPVSTHQFLTNDIYGPVINRAIIRI